MAEAATSESKPPRIQFPIVDFHATLLALLGLDHEKLTYPYAGRDFRLTETKGRIIKELIGLNAGCKIRYNSFVNSGSHTPARLWMMRLTLVDRLASDVLECWAGPLPF